MDNQHNIKFQKSITDYFKPIVKNQIIKGYNSLTNNFHCLECGVNMGKNPSQLCRKSWCDG